MSTVQQPLAAPRPELNPLPDPVSTAEVMARYLTSSGIKHLFGYPGDPNIEFLEAARREGIEMILGRREGTVAFMAEAYGMLTGRPGVCVSTLGPGSTSLVKALGNNDDKDGLDLNLDDFKAKINSDLVGKVVNIASRCAKLLAGQNLADTYPDDGGLCAVLWIGGRINQPSPKARGLDCSLRHSRWLALHRIAAVESAGADASRGAVGSGCKHRPSAGDGLSRTRLPWRKNSREHGIARSLHAGAVS